MAFPLLSRLGFAADRSVNQARARALFAQDLEHETPIEIEFTQQSTTDTGGVTLYTAQVHVPDWAAGQKIHGIVEGFVDAGTGQWRINGGTWVDITQTTIGLVSEAEGDLGSTAGVQSVTIEAKGPGSSNATYLRSQDLVAFWVEAA